MGTPLSSHDGKNPRTRAFCRAAALLYVAGFCLLPCCRLVQAVVPQTAQARDPNAAFVEPPAPEESSSNEEAGVAHLHGLLRCFDASLAQTQFAAAEDCLSHAERGVVRANSLTRSHPDFDDLADSVKAARPRLTHAIEQDRIAKRDQAIDALMGRGDIAYEHANALCIAQARPSPSADDIAELSDSHAALSNLLHAGEGFVDVPRYKAHAEQLKAALGAISQLRASMQWQLSTTTRLLPVIDAGFVAAAQAKAGGEAAKQLAAYKDVAQAFAQCMQISDAAQTEPGQDPNVLLESRLGSLSLSATREQCANIVKQATDRINRFGWEHLLGQLTEVLPAAQGKGQKAAEALTAALPLLSACAEGAPGTPEGTQADGWVFKSPFGNLAVPALRKACAKEALKLAPKQTSLAWQGRLETLVERLRVAEEGLAAATVTPAPIDALARLAQVSGSFEECAEAAQALGREPAAERNFKLTLGTAAINVDAVAKRCAQNAQSAQRALKKAADAAAQRQFLSTCHGDERAVFEREGMPHSVEVVGTGRIFVYGPHKRIAFDSLGRRTQASALAP